jgi:hypothetical protein
MRVFSSTSALCPPTGSAPAPSKARQGMVGAAPTVERDDSAAPGRKAKRSAGPTAAPVPSKTRRGAVGAARRSAAGPPAPRGDKEAAPGRKARRAARPTSGKSYTPLNAGLPPRTAHPSSGTRIGWARPISGGVIFLVGHRRHADQEGEGEETSTIGATESPTPRLAVVEAAEQAPARHEAADTAAGRGGDDGASPIT